MDKILRDGTKAKPGLKVKVIDSSGGHKVETITEITHVSGIVKNKINRKIDLDRWHELVKCGEWLQNLNSLVCFKQE